MSIPRCLLRVHLLALLLAVPATACIEDVPPGVETYADAGPDTDVDPERADPTYRRPCQAGDINCDEEGCNGAETDRAPAGCYQRCTPDGADLIGAPDDECAEPQRPYCSKLGLWLGGDYTCNGCVFACTAIADVTCGDTLAGCR